MDQFHLWFDSAQPEVKFENYGQDVYMDNRALQGGGICAGIAIKWLARWVASGKSSMMDSSKVNQRQLDFNQVQESEFQRYKKSIKPNGLVKLQDMVEKPQPSFGSNRIYKTNWPIGNLLIQH